MSAQLDLLNELDGGPVEEPPQDELEDRADEGSATPSTTAAPKAEEAAVDEEPPRPERRVSIHALHEERERRKESEAQLNQLREQAARMEERFAQFQQRWQEQQVAAQEPEVTYEDNPAEYLRRQTERLQQETEAQRQRNQQQEALAQQQASYRDFYAKVTSQEQQFAQQATDYYDAVQHLREARAQEYTAAGYAPEQVQAIITQEAHSVAANALRNGRNPAEAFYELAKLRGWSGQQAPSEPPPPSEEVQRLETVKRGVESNQTLGASGETAGRLTLAQLSEMDDDEFMAATDGDNWRKLWETSARR